MDSDVRKAWRVLAAHGFEGLSDKELFEIRRKSNALLSERNCKFKIGEKYVMRGPYPNEDMGDPIGEITDLAFDLPLEDSYILTVKYHGGELHRKNDSTKYWKRHNES